MPTPPNFAVFILTHGRAGRVSTLPKLREHGYTGPVFIVIDDEDSQGDAYRAEFGDAVLMFSKREIAERFDQGDNSSDRRTVFYARNAVWDLARQVGVRYFMQCDDDYQGFWIRTDARPDGAHRVTDLDAILSAMLDYFASIPALSIAMSQGGDHIGGPGGVMLRKAMNTFLCDTERPFRFVGRFNEDVNTYASLSRTGALFLTIPRIQVLQLPTQSNPGGITELYLESGTYVKAFTSVMYVPSAVKIAFLYYMTRKQRIHHRVHWPDCSAQILRERYRKPDALAA
jgi:hypothetical protein